MTTDRHTFGRALRQFVHTDRFWGVEELPVPPSVWQGRAAASHDKAGGGKQSAAASAEKQAQLEALDAEHVKVCHKCQLHETRNKTVFGVGSADARLVFVGEGPGFEEDRQGIPFVGRAGQLLTRMIGAMGLARDEVYICNIVKCRPPNNRDPEAVEVTACSPYLMEQLRIIDPEMIVALGAPAAKTLLQTADSIGRLRGRFHDFQLGDFLGEQRTVPLMPTYHPAYLLRSPDQKRKTWDDLKQVMGLLNLPLPQRR